MLTVLGPTKMLHSLLAIAMILAFPIIANANDDEVSLRCIFGPKFVFGEFSEKNDVQTLKSDMKPMDFVFDKLNVETKKGRFIGNAGAGDVLVFPSEDGLNIIEFTKSGNLNTTTVFYPKDLKKASELKAVHSRHTSFLGEPTPSQYLGTCKVI